MLDVVALGELLIDFTCISADADGYPTMAAHPGGAPANYLAAVTKFGGKTAMLGKVGTDAFGKLLTGTLEKAGIDTRGLIATPDVFTTLAFVTLDETGNREFSFARKPGADTCIGTDEVRYDLLDETKVLHFGTLSLTDEPSRSATWEAARLAKAAGALISYDPNYRASLWPDEETAKRQMRSLIPYVDLMKISDEETELLTGEKDAKKAAEALCCQGVKVVAVTMGGDGAYIYCRDGGSLVPGFQAERIGDTNGAGDSFWGGFLYKISTSEKRLQELAKEELVEYARFGNAVASLCVEKKGAIPAMPTLAQVETRMKRA